MKPLHIWINFFVEQPLLGEGPVGALRALLQRHLPTWSSGLVVARDEGSEGATVDSRKTLYRAIQEAAPARRHGFGDAVLTGSYEGLAIFLDGSRNAFPPESNSFSVEIVDVASVEGRPPTVWASEFFRDVPKSLPIRYGNARSTEEFEKKNIDTSGGGARAMGVNLQESLPGLYWLNFFGRPYLTLIGQERLLSTPAFEVQSIGDGVFVALDAEPTAWQTPAYQDQEERALDHLGREFFFQRRTPEAKTIAADLRPVR